MMAGPRAGQSWRRCFNTARLNGLDPYTWLNDVLERIVSGAVKSHELDQLLAWNWKAARRSEAVGMAA